jgi:hypothetical protein
MVYRVCLHLLTHVTRYHAFGNFGPPFPKYSYLCIDCMKNHKCKRVNTTRCYSSFGKRPFSQSLNITCTVCNLRWTDPLPDYIWYWGHSLMPLLLHSTLVTWFTLLLQVRCGLHEQEMLGHSLGVRQRHRDEHLSSVHAPLDHPKILSP